MAWRFVKQPNGKLAVFSDIVGTFIMYDMTEEEAVEYAREKMGREDALTKVRAGIEDHRPWTVGVKGTGLERWNDSLKTIEITHGKAERDDIEKEIGK
jgi:hypothetical protein